MAIQIRNISDYRDVMKNYGLSGKNPMNTFVRMGGTALGTRALDQINYGNSLEGARQGALNYGLSLFTPGANKQGMADAFGNASYLNANRMGAELGAQGRESGNYGPANQLAIAGAGGQNNDFLRYLYGGDYDAASLQRYLGLIQAGQDPSTLNNVAELAQGMEGTINGQQQRKMQRQAMGLGGMLPGLLQTGASLWGQGAFGGAGGAGRVGTPGINPSSNFSLGTGNYMNFSPNQNYGGGTNGWKLPGWG